MALTVDVDSIRKGWCAAFTHDLALDGDENLYVGARVQLTDGTVTASAVVTRHDYDAGYWYFTVIDDG